MTAEAEVLPAFADSHAARTTTGRRIAETRRWDPDATEGQVLLTVRDAAAQLCALAVLRGEHDRARREAEVWRIADRKLIAAKGGTR